MHIDHDVAIEQFEITTEGRGRPIKYPFDAMGIGDSFMVSTQAEAKSAYAAALHRGYRASMRKIEGGYRVWRTA